MSIELVSENGPQGVRPLRSAEAPDVLVVESNHRIANNLTLIGGLLRLQAADLAKANRTLSVQDACLVLAEAGGRIDAVGRLHRLLAQSGASAVLDVGQYLQHIAEAAISSMSARDMTLTQVSVASACHIPANQALSVGLIVGEAVTNAVKYAHPALVQGRIALDCRPQSKGGLLILIADDGVGLPEGFNPQKDGGLGLRMMHSIAKQLRATLSFETGEIGLTVRLLVPPGHPISDDIGA